MPSNNSVLDERILILAPYGRDAEVIYQFLSRNGFECGAVPHFDTMVSELSNGAGACVIAEEVLQDSGVRQLINWLEAQEPWSDFPFVVLISKGSSIATSTARSTFDQLGNIVLLERPLNSETLRSAAASALRGRRRQYEARKILQERKLAAEKLRDSQVQLLQLNETLESRIEERTRALAQANDRLMTEVIELGSTRPSPPIRSAQDLAGKKAGG
ncbi:hypothetical protein [Undibacterium sp. TJN19]|uniref:hypothetical protein n=1 Tax=Undibacterium sp. TJN19 TaxID=3413055 RepID=UPI003BF189B0